MRSGLYTSQVQAERFAKLDLIHASSLRTTARTKAQLRLRWIDRRPEYQALNDSKRMQKAGEAENLTLARVPIMKHIDI